MPLSALPATPTSDVVLEVLATYLELPELPLLESSLLEDLGADGLDEVEIVWELETRFDISIPELLWVHMKTAADVVSLVERLRSEKEAT
jgi:acyl carrier protein